MTVDRWGPFGPDLDPCERRARLRSVPGMIGRQPRRIRGMRYIAEMIRRAILTTVVALAAAPAFGQGIDATFLNSIRDRARAEERQAESLRQLERIEHDRARDVDRARRNAARDSRSARRFDQR